MEKGDRDRTPLFINNRGWRHEAKRIKYKINNNINNIIIKIIIIGISAVYFFFMLYKKFFFCYIKNN